MVKVIYMAPLLNVQVGYLSNPQASWSNGFIIYVFKIILLYRLYNMVEEKSFTLSPYHLLV
jgi:hypothetical protein